MDEEKQEPVPQEICTIRIMFPVVTDQQALDCKQTISKAMGGIPNVRIDFNIMSMPPRPTG